MGLINTIMSILPLRKRSNQKSNIQLLRNEIEKLQKENKELKEKIIVFHERNNEKVPIKFFDENIEGEIVRNIREAKEELCIAAAWLTSNILINELSNIKSQGINIKIIISDDESNNQQKLLNVSNSLKTVVLPNRGRYKNYMHHKYCIIDNKRVIDGSYNWSNNAQYNLEHIIVIESKTVAKMFRDNFDKISSKQAYYLDSRMMIC